MEAEEPPKPPSTDTSDSATLRIASVLKEYDYDSLEELEEDISSTRKMVAKYEQDNKQKKKTEELEKLKKLESILKEVEKAKTVEPVQ